MSLLPKKVLAKSHHAPEKLRISGSALAASRLPAGEVQALLKTTSEGLTESEASRRLIEGGPNILARDQSVRFVTRVGRALRDPLVILLGVLAGVSYATADARAGSVMLLMIALSVSLKLIQEGKAGVAAQKLKALISVKATVLRDGSRRECPVRELVPGDVIELRAGDMVPADVRVLTAKNLFVVQGALTGESFPVEKCAEEKSEADVEPLAWTGTAFLGTSVASGSARCAVVATGESTYLGGVADSLSARRGETAFDRGIARFTWLMLGFMGVMAPLVFLTNGLVRGTWQEAFFFALAVAVGLTPEMLPMIVTVCLSKGAVRMGAKRVIVKELQAIQNLGAMSVLCTDKTGTLTLDKVVLEKHCDVTLREDEAVLALAYLNSHFQTGLKSILDDAVLQHELMRGGEHAHELAKVDEIPFDFERRMLSVIVRTPEGADRMICKGAPEAVFEKCSGFRQDGQSFPMDHPHIETLGQEYQRLSREGFRVLAIATKEVAPKNPAVAYGKSDESELILEGYVAFLDPPKESARAAISALAGLGVRVKVITGDNELVARKVCREVGLAVEDVLLGSALERLSDAELATRVNDTVLFARVSPAHKERIVRALQAQGLTVGFMGDGINDAPALHAADVGVSVDTAVDIAKESADIILLEKSLLVLVEGVMEGRRVFANILNYVRMGASSNFGNMFSVLGASVLLPFLPMKPIQILANNLLYDVGQTAIPTDRVDEERIRAPHTWDMKQLTRYILFIGPCSSIFDYATFFIMLHVFGCNDVSTPARALHSQSLFQTGWFVESLLTQTLIINIIRTNKIPWLQSRPSPQLLSMSVLIAAVGVALPYTPVASYLGFTALPLSYWPWLLGVLACYALLTQLVKAVLIRRAFL